MQTETRRNPKKKWIILGVISFLLVVVAVNIFLLQSKKKDKVEDLQFAKVTERTLSNTKLISGKVVPGETEQVYVDPTKGKVKEIFVKEGQSIEAKTKLFSYENSELALQMKQADVEKKMTSLRFEQEKKKIASTKDEIQKAKATGAGADVIGPLEAQLQELEFQHKSTELEIERNDLQMEELKKKQSELIVYSEHAGVVRSIDESSMQGNAMGAKPFMQIASNEPYQIQGTLTELQKGQIRPDQPITVTAKAVANKTWKGKITEVSEYPAADEAGDAVAAGQQTQMISYYSYKAVLESQDELAPGYHVSLEVDLSSKKMMAVPRSSVVEKGNGVFVYVVEKGKVHKKEVTTGISDGEWMEITDGVKAGDKVVKNPSSKVTDGMEVDVRD